jgi:ABC-2 type transport system permease protein
MRLFLSLVGFELRYYLRAWSTYVYFGIFFSLAALCTLIAGGAFKSVAAAIGGASGIVYANSPHVAAGFTSALGLFAILIVTAVTGNAVYRDYEAGIHPLFFTTPVPKWTFLGGRFVGAILVNAVIFLSIPLGLMAGLLYPDLMPDHIGPFHLVYYAWPYLFMLLPTLVFTGAIFFALASFTRKMLPNYLGGVTLLVGYLLSARLLSDIDNKVIAGLCDPFGSRAYGVVTEYWTASEKNTQLAPIIGLLGANRLLWLGIGLVVFVACAVRFKFAHRAAQGRNKKAASDASQGAGVGPGVAFQLPDVAREFGFGAQFAQLVAITRRSFASIAFNGYFVAIAFAGLLFLVLSAGQVGKIYGTPTWPVTYEVLEILGGTFALFTVIIIAFFAGELVWQERDLKVNQVTDTMPTATWSALGGKLIALCLVVASLQIVVLAAGMITQLTRDFHDVKPALYLKVLLGLNVLDFVLVAVLAFLVHVVVNQKYVGHLVLVLTYFGVQFMGTLGLTHNLYRYGSDPGWSYSDMNRFGPFMGAFGWFKLYWCAIALVLAVLVNVLWVRGQEKSVPWRLRMAKGRLPGMALRIGSGALIVAACVGTWIFYNTNVRNEYRTANSTRKLTAAYERTYKKYETLPQPRVTDVKIACDIHPKEGSVHFAGTYRLVNKTAVPIPAIHVLLNSTAELKTLEFTPAATLQAEDKVQGYRIYQLAEPLAPGSALTCRFDLQYERHGFTNDGASTAVVENGTFVNSSLLPSFGYDSNGELSDDDDRKKEGLPPKERMHRVDDMAARMNTYISHDADWVTFDATVSTDPDQIAIAPGYLENDWIEGGRRYFHYTMDRPILDFFSFLSARYAVKKDSWNGLPIEIYYHPGHEYNLDTMIKAVKKGLDYYTKAFGPYQYRQVRILEFPRYASFAQSFPNTIPFSESIGFIARLDEESRIAYPFYVTAHEVAHQWWAHQVIGADVQGSTLMSETMAQYSALMVMEHEYGPDQMRKFLRYELDNYLQGRAFERKKELPLALNENQPYIHYRKGSLVMYALKDYLGEDTLNAAIRGYLERVKEQGPPYTNSLEFVDAIRKAVPPDRPDLQGLVDDLFMKITLWDLRAKDATITKLPDGKWQVVLNYEAKKYHADEKGVQTEAPMDLPIDVGVFAMGKTNEEDDDVPLLLEKRLISGDGTLTLVVDKKPIRAGIDPYHKLIDRRSDDNVVKVKEGAAPST